MGAHAPPPSSDFHRNWWLARGSRRRQLRPSSAPSSDWVYGYLGPNPRVRARRSWPRRHLLMWLSPWLGWWSWWPPPRLPPPSAPAVRWWWQPP
uniref:Uncharacterized protein n=1 Tax=Arundo donax TaxID=35708 RepID=A0A0A9A8V4_ARUDO